LAILASTESSKFYSAKFTLLTTISLGKSLHNNLNN
jgi:hypothetical protein